jgi:hypothetical protein
MRLAPLTLVLLKDLQWIMCFADARHALPEPLLVIVESQEMKNKKIVHDSLLLRLCYWDICNICVVCRCITCIA